MKKLLLLTSVLLSLNTFAQQGVWISQASGFQTQSSGVRYISVVDTSTLWMCAYDGATAGLPRNDYSRTVNGGANWIAGTVPVTTSFDWAMIDGFDDSTAWALFFNAGFNPPSTGQIWHTTDAGATWTRQAATAYSVVGESFPNIIHFWSRDTGVVVGDPVAGKFEIYTTVNGGTTWDSVPAANIATPLTDEAGWTTHLAVKGDTIWFDTNTDRVYRSVDRGHHWTAYTVGLPVPAGEEYTLAFYSSSSGVARYFDATAQSDTVVETSDGGQTWSPFVPSGTFFSGDFAAVPGTDSMLVSTGIDFQNSNQGSSYSLNGGHSWTLIDTTVQRGTLGIADSIHMWCGGFTSTDTTDGVFKYTLFPTVACTDASINPGTTSLSAGMVCDDDIFTFSDSGFVSPEDGYYSGMAWVISTSDISGSSDPLNESSLVAGFAPNIPDVDGNDSRRFQNAGQLAAGIYYFTPVVFGNASINLQAGNTTIVSVLDLQLDPACTFAGNSLPIEFLDPANPICTGVGINEINSAQLSVTTFMADMNTADVKINSYTSGKSTIQFVDLTGRIVKSVVISVSNGVNHETIDVSDLAAGTYAVKAVVNGNTAVNKLFKY